MDQIENAEVSAHEVPIRRPGAPEHQMRIAKDLTPRVISVDGQDIARPKSLQVVHEKGRKAYDPVFYFSRDDLVGASLIASGKSTVCPLKGTARYFHLLVGERQYDNAAWSYEDVLTFDPRLSSLTDQIALDPAVARFELT